MTTFQTITDSHRFIDWLVASSRLEDLRWVNRLGATVYAIPRNDFFMGADEDLADAWENLSWADQRFCIVSAADQLLEIETLSAQCV